MSVKVNNVSSVYEVQASQRIAGPSRAAKADGKKDVVALSPVAREFHLARQALSAVPDIRAELVESIKAQMADGTYSVSSADIADKMFSDYLQSQSLIS